MFILTLVTLHISQKILGKAKRLDGL